MNVVVCGKVIPASTVIIELDANSKRMVRKGVPHELDPMAASAVEEGLRLAEKHGGSVVLVTMGASDVTIGRPAKRQAGKAVVDEGEGGKQIADFLAEIKVI